MKKISLILSIYLLISSFALAQGDYEAFRFSQTDYQGTARYMGAGGAFGATGGEFSALNSNPAAIGLFKRSDVSFTPLALSFSTNNTMYLGENASTQNPKYTVPECGLIIASEIKDSPWKYWQFGFGYNRIMDYNNTFRMCGTGTNSIVNTIIDQANGTHFNNLSGDASLAWSTWMMDTILGTTNQYYSPFTNTELNHDALVKTSGSMDEMDICFGGNYNDQLFIGANIGIPILDYTERITYTEAVTGEPALWMNDMQTSSTQHNTGGGINLKLGIIYQPINFFRIGLGFQTPTYFWKIKDQYSRNMISYYNDGTNSDYWSYDNDYAFSLTTPLKFNISAAFLINKRAFVSAEYEFMDYSQAKLYANDYNFSSENSAIEEKYGICNTLRLGAEVNVSQKFVLRAGYNLKTSPYKLIETDYNATTHYGSLGFGIRSKYIFFDMAYVLRYSKDSYWLYSAPAGNLTTSDSPVAETTNCTHRIVATIGCKF